MSLSVPTLPAKWWGAKIIVHCADFCRTAWAAPAEQVRNTLCWLFLASIVLFPVGPSVREILPSLCGLVLARYYYLDWNNSTLKRFRPRILWFALVAGILVGVVFSQNVWESFLHVSRHVNKGYVYPLVAMECVRSSRELQRIIWAFVIVSFWQGLNGLWQSYSGFDFIDNTPIMYGRLTGSMSTYRVGNYIALSLMPAMALWPLLRQHSSRLMSTTLCALLWLPPLYLLLFSYTRSGYLALMVGLCLVLYMHTQKYRLYFALLPVVGLVALMLLLPQRLGPDALAGDGRWQLWHFAWDVFITKPWFGVGFGEYNVAFRSLGLAPLHDPITISHPHSIYLQFLCEAGVVGAAFLNFFLLGFLYWGFVRVNRGLALARQQQLPQHSAYWRMTAFIWASWGAYTANGIFGHDFFRLWWFAQAMILLGVLVGACIHGPQDTDSTNKSTHDRASGTSTAASV